ncbi:NAD(P)H-binding protein [Gracilibacillus salitolerans]|uniref:NAD(P)H-binding protein n=1 Tax=Gracilibacillus salitolerans TaxID=2663022 RepID=A0A5Q2TGE4_9BACI|nr:SDR family oxidoreductase [Gracilibacillus salitolerans]QGH33685.1 NAD(P)H-binding protein [Gracilibacillus salitolerans]
MKLIVFGATGDTGRQLVKQLLSEGHEVTAVVRQPDQFTMSDKHLQVIKGDVLNPSTLEKSMTGKDAVLSAIGVQHRKPTTVYSKGIENIKKAMRKCEVQRLICLSSEMIKPREDFTLMERITSLFLKRILKHLYKDMERMEQKIFQSNLDWTIIRPPRLTNGSRTSKHRISINQPVTKAKSIKGISRADLAECMVTQLNNPDSISSIIYISY